MNEAKAPKIVDPMEKDFECVLGQLNKARGRFRHVNV